ncbi:hypothetical protein V1504DRAFT_261927 [Lipomyces starkeyi]
MNAAVQLGVGIFCHVHIRYSLACLSTSHTFILAGEFSPLLPALNITSQNLQPDVLSVLKDPQGALSRKGRPRRTRRLQTSAEIIQKVADRIEKVRRCGSCHKGGHTRRKCPKFLTQQPSQGTDEGRYVLTQTTNTIEEMAENDAVVDTALEEDESIPQP